MLFFFAAAWRALRDSYMFLINYNICSFSLQLPGRPYVIHSRVSRSKGAFFHWKQAVWRHIQQFGLSSTYQQREGVYDYIRQLVALPFLPACHIPPTLDYLKTKANSEPLMLLVEYMDRQWFSHPVFDVPLWSVFEHAVHTNNEVEGNDSLMFMLNSQFTKTATF